MESFLVIPILGLFKLIAHVQSVDVHWNNNATLRFNRGDNVELNCTLQDVDSLMVAIISKVYRGTVQDNLEIVKNHVWGEEFGKSRAVGRYQNKFDYYQDTETATITLNITDLQPEDSGVYRCNDLSDPNSVADVTLDVASSVQEVELGTYDDNDTLVQTEGVIEMVYGNLTTVECRAWRVGIHYPTLQLLVGGQDETDRFELSSFREPYGVGVKSVVSLIYNTTKPTYTFNGKTLVCNATSQNNGSQILQAQTELVVFYPPVFMCPTKSYVIAPGDYVDILCNIYGNPRPTAKWYIGNKGLTVIPHTDTSVEMSVKYLANDTVEAVLTIPKVEQKHFQQYTLEAQNSFKTERYIFTLSEANRNTASTDMQPNLKIAIFVTLMTIFSISSISI